MSREMNIQVFKDRADLVRAYQRLEQPGVVGKLNSAIGKAGEKFTNPLPSHLSQNAHHFMQRLIEHALNTAILTLGQKPNTDSFHSTLVSISGAASGLLGVTGLATDLPLTTLVILRSVADIARKEGEDLETCPARAACLSVLAMSGRPIGENTAKSNYYTVRIALANAVTDESTEFGLHTVPANTVAKLVPLVTTRFGAMMSQKIPSQSVPLVGAFGGAAVNTILIRHYQRMAHGHFTIRRLERVYGTEIVKHEYEALN